MRAQSEHLLSVVCCEAQAECTGALTPAWTRMSGPILIAAAQGEGDVDANFPVLPEVREER